ncbi:MAG TPA: carbon storage regulator [Paenibacillus sp.]|nr:carbon storage regulator [Paenibacillus sp.]
MELVVLGVEGDSVKIGVNAPKQIGIFRKEIYTSIQVSNREASRTRISPDQLGSLFPKK